MARRSKKTAAAVEPPAEIRTVLPNSRVTPRFAGLVTFGRYPRLADVLPASRPVDWAVFGVPFDAGVTYRPGARFGPRAIREESQYLKPFHLEYQLLLTEILSLADAGDAPVAPFDLRANSDLTDAFARQTMQTGVGSMLALGGDHSIALGNIRATAAAHAPRGRRLGLIHFDSHLDTVDQVWGQTHSHASPFRRAIEEGLIDPALMLSVGVKGPLNTPDDLRFAQEHGVTVVTRADLDREGTRRIDAFIKKLGDHPCYLTFDVDVIDPAFAPGTGTPSVGGLTTSDALALLRHLAISATGKGPPNIVGADVVEVLPDRDVGGATALLAAHIAFEVLCLAALRRVATASGRA
ncbi:MAG: agmatinase [Planctomycetota bacterium]|nr:agmatinase [Planctomycetota bacterium]